MRSGGICFALAIGMTIARVMAIVGQGTVVDQRVQKPKMESFAGTIRALDVAKQVMTVETTPLSKTFGIAPDCEVVTKNKPEATPGDLAVGNVVTITYQEEAGGLLVAHRIEKTGPSQQTGNAKRKPPLMI